MERVFVASTRSVASRDVLILLAGREYEEPCAAQRHACFDGNSGPKRVEGEQAANTVETTLNYTEPGVLRWKLGPEKG
tara:strand:+ start:414 stop:647 length:234 start_codon:yes stop_codon:yes gene_type:complete